MSNFAFIQSSHPNLAESALRAEAYIFSDPRSACFQARYSLENAVYWIYRHEKDINWPYDRTLGALLHEPSFQNLIPEAVFQKARVIKDLGNQAVHGSKPIKQLDAIQVTKELHHFLYWLARTYFTGEARPTPDLAWDSSLIPRPTKPAPAVSQEQLKELERRLEEQIKADQEKQRQIDERDEEIQRIREELAQAKAANQAQEDTHDYSEAETRHYLIDVELRRAGWPLDQSRDREYEVQGMPNQKGIGYADYVLWGDDGKPLAVVEAKRSTVEPEAGKQQAKLYADCLEQMHGQRPIIFYTNGYETWLWDDQQYPPRQVSGFYKKEELRRLMQRRSTRQPLDVAKIKEAIAGRYYQKRAIGSICSHFAQSQRKALLVMATGTGKTRTAIALVDLLQRCNWAKSVLFLADRVSLVKQATDAFKSHLPDSSPVNLVTEKDTEGRVYACTYPTMMGLIDETKDGAARFGVGHFDLVIIDEAHRSIYQRYREIFRYFDSLLVGLTATPRDQVDRNTYHLFDLEQGVPTDAYELDQAVKDGFLVPPKASIVDLRFPREGISYEQLSDEEKAEWESLDWGDEAREAAPDSVHASAVNRWLFNTDTVDKVLEILMRDGIKVEQGDRLGKTIIFAPNHDHAIFIEQRFNHHYPQYKGSFARVIDNKAKYPQSLIDDFSIKDKEPHIAISVDMMDTGIDVPEVVNLVFFKPVFSKIKFWQMIGRGTRLCPDLFGPDQDKEDFRIFDFCFNFAFFEENPDGIEGSGSESLGTKLFRNRVQLIAGIQENSELEPSGKLTTSIRDLLHAEVRGMNADNFLVRPHLKHVERFSHRQTWEKLSEQDIHDAVTHLAGLPTEVEDDDLEAKLFDLRLLRMQLALVQDDSAQYEKDRLIVVAIAEALHEKDNVPAVREQIDLIRHLQEVDYWEGMDLLQLEQIRERLRGLIHLLDKGKRKTVYTHFEDQVVSMREQAVVQAPSMTGAQYQKKVEAYLQAHQDHIAIQRLRHNQPLTDTDLQSLEEALVEIGNGEGQQLLKDMLVQSEAPSLAWFVRSLVGMDRQSAQAAFSKYLSDRSLTPRQIRFIELVVDQLTAKGVMQASALYESPFTDLDTGGPEAIFTGKDKIVDEVFAILENLRSQLLRAE